MSQVPGVSVAGASTDLPLGVRDQRGFSIEQESPATRELPHSVAHQTGAGRFFEAVGIPLKRGRYSTRGCRAVGAGGDHQRNDGSPFLGHADPVGQRMKWGNLSDRTAWMHIVGVVGDVKQGPLNSETIRTPTRRGCRCRTP